MISWSDPDNMPFLPIAERELRVTARRPSTYWLRFLVPLVLLVVATWVFLSNRLGSQQQSGMMIFHFLSSGLLLYTLTAGLRFTADCLAEEKREGTLGLLFLTDLRGYDVVLGKLLANSLTVFYGLLAGFPILALPLLMGGVSGAEFGRLTLVLVNTLFFSLCVGMLASAVCRTARTAIGLTLWLLVLAAGGSPVAGLIEWKLRNWSGIYNPIFMAPSPLFSYVLGVDAMFNRGFGRWFPWSVGMVQGYAWICLGLASWIIRHRWQDRPETVRGGQWRAWWQELREGNAEVRHRFRSRLLDRNAFWWLATRPRARALTPWLVLVIVAGGWSWGYLKVGNDWLIPQIYGATAVLLGLVMKVMIGAEAGRRVLEDRRIGSFELLLSTPLTVHHILQGQRLALQRQFAGPVIVGLAVVCVLWVAAARSGAWGIGLRSAWFWVWLGGVVTFFADVVALYWLGLWTAMSVKNPRNAFGAAILPVLGLPFVAMLVVGRLVSPSILVSWLDGPRPMGWLIWFSLGWVVDLAFARYARRRFLAEFRTLGAQRFQPAPSWWARLFGK